MKELVAPIIDLIKALVTPSQGTKFLITVVGMGTVGWLCYKGLATTPVILGIVGMVVAFHLSNIFLTHQDIKRNGAKKTEAKP